MQELASCQWLAFQCNYYFPTLLVVVVQISQRASTTAIFALSLYHKENVQPDKCSGASLWKYRQRTKTKSGSIANPIEAKAIGTQTIA